MVGKMQDDKASHEAFAKQAHGETWTLLGKTERTPDEDEQMIHAAHASLYHWLIAGTEVNAQRGEWLLARVYTVLEHDQFALHHALRCMDLTLAHPDALEDFDRAFAEESLARAYALMGDHDEAHRHYDAAAAAGKQIHDDEDRRVFMEDFEKGPWFGLTGE